MKFNLSFPQTGLQKHVEFNDEKKLKVLNDKRLSQYVEMDFLGDEYKGYIAKIMGGNDKDGFAMKQGILTTARVRMLLRWGNQCFNNWKRKGEKRRRSVRGCIIDTHNLSVLNLKVVRKGEGEIPGLTDRIKPRLWGPKRASKIRKMFNLSKKDDVRLYVIRRTKRGKTLKDGTPRTAAPKIQRLITPERLQRKRKLRAQKRKRFEKKKSSKEDYLRLLAKLKRQRMEAAKKRSSRSSTRISQCSKS